RRVTGPTSHVAAARRRRAATRTKSGCGVSAVAMRPRLLSDGALGSLRVVCTPGAGQHSIRHGLRKVHSMGHRSALVARGRLADATGGWLPRRPTASGGLQAAGDPGGRTHGRRVLEQDTTDLLDREWIALDRVSGEGDHELGFDTGDARALVRDDAVGRV